MAETTRKITLFEESVNNLPRNFLLIPNLILVTNLHEINNNEARCLTYLLNLTGTIEEIAAALEIKKEKLNKTLKSAMDKVSHLSDATAKLGPDHIKISRLPQAKSQLIGLLVAGGYFTQKPAETAEISA